MTLEAGSWKLEATRLSSASSDVPQVETRGLEAGSFRRKIRVLIFASSFQFLASSFCYADSSVIEVKTRAWPTRVAMGDEIKLAIRVSHPIGYSLKSLPPDTNLSPFEMKTAAPFSSKETGGRVEEVAVLPLAVFQLGDLQIPAISLTVTDSQGHADRVFTEPIKVKVVGVPKRPTDGKDIRPIKGPISLAKGLIRNLWLGLFALFLAIFLTVKIMRRRKKKIIDLESLKPPHERAALELERLRKKRFLEEGKTKEFYSELSDILRRYFDRGFRIDTLERTTLETLKVLKEKNFPEPALAKIRNVLQNSDLVKFAKYIPPPSLGEELAGEASQIVELTKPPVEAETNTR